MGLNWILPMFAAGTCSAGAIVLLRDSPRFAPGMPALVMVGAYMLIGGVALLAVAGLAGISSAAVTWPNMSGMLRIAVIGVLLAALEAFFVVAARATMPLPDAMIVYNLTSLALVTAAGLLLFNEALTSMRLWGLGFGVLSVILLLQPSR